MDATLYQLSEALLALLDDAELAEEEVSRELDALLPAIENKVEDCGHAYRYYTDKAKTLRERGQNFMEAARKADATATRIKEYVSRNMTAMDMTRLEAGDVSVSFRKSTAVDIFAEEAIPAEYTKTTTTADKKKIAEALKNGQEIAGAKLAERRNVQIK